MLSVLTNASLMKLSGMLDSFRAEPPRISSTSASVIPFSIFALFSGEIAEGRGHNSQMPAPNTTSVVTMVINSRRRRVMVVILLPNASEAIVEDVRGDVQGYVATGTAIDYVGFGHERQV